MNVIAICEECRKRFYALLDNKRPYHGCVRPDPDGVMYLRGDFTLADLEHILTTYRTVYGERRPSQESRGSSSHG